MRSVVAGASWQAGFDRVMKRLLQPRPIRTLLALMSLALIVPALGFTSYLVIRSATMERDQVEQRLIQVAGDLADSIDREFERLLSLLDTLALSQPLAQRDFATFHVEATVAMRRLGATILVVDPSMQQLVNTRVPYGTPLPPIADPESLREAQAKQAPVVSNLVFGAVVQKYVFNVIAPVTIAGAGGYTLILAVNAEQLLKIMEGQKLPPVWVTGISDGRGTIVARSKDHASFVGKPLPGNLLEASRQGAGAFATINLEGERTIRAVAKSKLAGWLVSANVLQSVVDAEIHRAQWALAIGGLGLLVLASVLASIFARWIIAPMQALAASAVSLEARDIPAPLASPVVEANDVAGALRSASIELKARTVRLRESETRLILAQKTAGLTHMDIDIVNQQFVASETFEEILGNRPADGDLQAGVGAFLERVHKDDRKRVRAVHVEAAGKLGPFRDEFRIVLANGAIRWISAQGETRGDAGGQPDRMIVTCLDITYRKEQEEHIRFLLREVSHRSKNLLAIIQAMATQTARTSRSIGEFQSRFSQRLQGMAASHDLLVNQNWEGVNLDALVRAQLRPFAEDIGGRLEVVGPNLLLRPDAAQSLGLALHELATNATKYGALSNAGGKVRINWDITGDSEPARFHLEWRESGGPSVAVPERKGFGHTVFERIIGQALKATIDLRYETDGVAWSLDADLASVSERVSVALPEASITA
jgi:two-component sensor histidine kinase